MILLYIYYYLFLSFSPFISFIKKYAYFQVFVLQIMISW